MSSVRKLLAGSQTRGGGSDRYPLMIVADTIRKPFNNFDTLRRRRRHRWTLARWPVVDAYILIYKRRRRRRKKKKTHLNLNTTRSDRA